MSKSFNDFSASLNSNVLDRIVFEAKKSAIESNDATEVTSDNATSVLAAHNSSMCKTLTDIAKTLSNEHVAKMLFATKYDATRINRSERSNARYNVYAYEKDVNIARVLCKVASLNHYTRAILSSAIALQKNDMLITHRDAQSACSLDVKTDATREKLISATKYQKNVAASTANTQSSSSINALQAFSVLVETRDAANNVCYKVNLDADVTKKLLALI